MGPFYEAALAVHQRKTLSINLFFERDKNSVFLCFPPAWWTDPQRGRMRIECPLMIRLVGGMCVWRCGWLVDCVMRASSEPSLICSTEKRKSSLGEEGVGGDFRNMARAGKQHKRQDLLWKCSLLTKLVDCLRGLNLRDFWSKTIFCFARVCFRRRSAKDGAVL